MGGMNIYIRMMLWYLLLIGALLTIGVPVLYTTLAGSLYDSEVKQLQAAVTEITADVESEDGVLKLEEGIELPSNMYAVVVDADGRVLAQNNNFSWITQVEFKQNVSRILDGENGERWIAYDEAIEDNEQSIAYIRTVNSTGQYDEAVGTVKTYIFFGVPVVIAIAIISSLLITRRALAPVAHMSKTANEIGSENLSWRIDGIDTKDEIGTLAATFNSMLERLETSFEREKQFSSDVSHELRTPVTVIQTYVEEAIQKTQGNEEVSELLAVIQREGRKMSQIISQLLLLIRGAEGRFALEKESVNLHGLAEAVMEELAESAQEKAIHLKNSIPETTEVTGDASLLTQMMINLLQNGIKYGRFGGYICATAEADSSGVTLIIEDDGIGISEQDISHIFDRFYRADKARDRSGAGLGLSIVKWIAVEHGGSVNATSGNGKTQMVIRLKLNP